MTKGDETLGLPWPWHLHQTMGLRVTEVQCWLPHQCHHCLIDLEAPGISHHGQCHWGPRSHMKINLPIFKDEDKKDAITYQSWCWDITMYHQAGCWDCTSSPTSSTPYRVTQGSWWGVQALTSLWMVWLLCWMSITTMSRPWMPWTRSFSNYERLTKKGFQIGGCASQGPSKSLWPYSQKGSYQTTLLNWSDTTSMVG